jgi:predicted transcriptional regulator
MSERKKKKKKASSLLAKGRLHELLYSEKDIEADVYLTQFQQIIGKAGFQEEDVTEAAELKAKREFCKRIEEMAKKERRFEKSDLFFKILESLQEPKTLQEVTNTFPNERRIQETLDNLEFCKYVRGNDKYSLTGKGRRIFASLKQQ